MVWLFVWMEDDGVSVNDKWRGCRSLFLCLFFVLEILKDDVEMEECQKTNLLMNILCVCSSTFFFFFVLLDLWGWFLISVIVVLFPFTQIQLHCPVIIILTDQTFSCFYIAVFYHFGSFNVFFILLLDIVFTLRCLHYVKVLTSESHCVLVTERWSVCFSAVFSACSSVSHTYTDTAISHSLLLCIYVGIL